VLGRVVTEGPRSRRAYPEGRGDLRDARTQGASRTDGGRAGQVRRRHVAVEHDLADRDRASPRRAAASRCTSGGRRHAHVAYGGTNRRDAGPGATGRPPGEVGDAPPVLRQPRAPGESARWAKAPLHDGRPGSCSTATCRRRTWPRAPPSVPRCACVRASRSPPRPSGYVPSATRHLRHHAPQH